MSEEDFDYQPIIKKQYDCFVEEFGYDPSKFSILECKINKILSEIPFLYDFSVICDQTTNSPEDVNQEIINLLVMIKRSPSLGSLSEIRIGNSDFIVR